MKSYEVIDSIQNIERSIWRLRNAKGVKHAKWLVLALKGLETYANGIRQAVEHVTKLSK
jgi:hypothetical protein